MIRFDPRADSRYAWFRLAIAMLLMTIGGCGMYAIVVVLPSVQADFGVSRSGASLPYTLTLIGFGVGGILMGRLADRRGVRVPLLAGSVCLGLGFVLAAQAQSLMMFALAQGLLIGLLGSSATFGPLMTDTSFWFVKRRGIAVAICAAGNYLAGTVWPPIVEWTMRSHGWRGTYVGIGVFCILTMVPLSLLMRRRPVMAAAGALQSAAGATGVAATASASAATASATRAATATPANADFAPAAAGAARLPERPLGWSSGFVMTLLSVAGVACCVAMSMPQVHIVAYCGDLGYGAARGAQMLSLMLGFGVVSRLVSGVICDRIGGLRTLMLGSLLQGIALLLFLPFDGMASLFVISALFGLFQGGIVPAYAIIVRELFSPEKAGARVGIALMATLLGMALGGWMSGKLFDLTGSYDAAFINGIAWNLLNVAIVALLLYRSRRLAGGAPALRAA